MIKDLFNRFNKIKDTNNPFCDHFVLDDGSDFYIEPAFYTQLNGFKERHNDDAVDLIVNRMVEIVNKNHHVVFVGNFEFPQTEVDDKYIFLEITDVTDPLKIFVEDKSRGSDYGD